MSDIQAKMHQIGFLLDSVPDPAGGAYSQTRWRYLKGLLLRGGTRRGEWNEKEMAKGREGEKRWREGFWPSQKFWPGAPYGLGYRSNAVIKVWCRYLKNLWQKESVGYFLTTLWVVPFQSRCSAHRVLLIFCLSVTVTMALCMPTAAEQSLLYIGLHTGTLKSREWTSRDLTTRH